MSEVTFSNLLHFWRCHGAPWHQALRLLRADAPLAAPSAPLAALLAQAHRRGEQLRVLSDVRSGLALGC